MENYESILSYLSTILLLLFTTITYVVKFIEKQKEIKRMNDLDMIETELERLMVEAEKLFDDGNSKELFVLDRLRSYAKDYRIRLDFEGVKTRIGKLIKITKEVNVKGDKILS
jgi:hypothetical protein